MLEFGPPLVVVFFITFIYSIFSTCTLIPQIFRLLKINSACSFLTVARVALRKSNQNCLLNQYHIDPYTHQSSILELVLVLIFFHVAFIMFLVSMWCVTASDPGEIPNNKRWQGGIIDEIDRADEDRIGRIMSNMKYELSPEDMELIKTLLVIERKKKKWEIA